MLLEITLEQGQKRNSQVQPPVNVWTHYFGFSKEELDMSPNIALVDGNTGVLEYKKVVCHDHNYTVELPGAKKGMILRVYRKSNPLTTSGRLWVTI